MEYLVNRIDVARANASTIVEKILKSILRLSISLNARYIHGQAYDEALVMSSEKHGAQDKPSVELYQCSK